MKIYIKRKKHMEECFVSFFFQTGNPAIPLGMINEFHQTASFSVISLPHPS